MPNLPPKLQEIVDDFASMTREEKIETLGIEENDITVAEQKRIASVIKSVKSLDLRMLRSIKSIEEFEKIKNITSTRSNPESPNGRFHSDDLNKTSRPLSHIE